MPPASRLLCLFFASAMVTAAARGQVHDPVALSVAVVADGDRAAALDAVLRDAGMRRRRIATAECTPEALRLVDVVVVDWPGEIVAASPLGALDRWDRPTLFVGGCGDEFAHRWGLLTAKELTELPAAKRTPEIEVLGPTLVRQGNLFHFAGAAPEPSSADERERFAAVLRLAARFAADRAILRHATVGGAPLPPAEIARRERIDATAKQLGKDVASGADMVSLPDLLGGANRDAVERLLVDAIADGPGAGTSRNNWKFWFQAHADDVVWDDVSRTWRLDRLAYARSVPSRELVGANRGADPPVDAEALGLAAKVAQKYGGRALDDLATFTCWQGDVHCSWDRRAGVFRAENHHVLKPGALATAWSLAVFDTFAEVDVIKGGGPPPRPTVSALGAFRELVGRAFLPALLLDPGTTLARRAADDDGNLRALDVRLSTRGMGGCSYRLFVRADGTIERCQDLSSGRKVAWNLGGTTVCGPLTLPSTWLAIDSRRPTSWTLVEPAWNPALPHDLATATEKLTKPRPANEPR